MGRVICCAQGTCKGVNIDATPDPPSLCVKLCSRMSNATPGPLSLNVKLCSRTSKSLSLGVLTAINSHSSRQLLENNTSFTLCSIHILFISNKFHKFWMSFDFGWTSTKNGQIWAKTQAVQPPLGRPAWHLYTLWYVFDPGVKWHPHIA